MFAVIDGLSRDPHAIHVHVFGDCSTPDATSAGPHFHFMGSSFDKEPGYITGNLGELRHDAIVNKSTYQGRVDNVSTTRRSRVTSRSSVARSSCTSAETTRRSRPTAAPVRGWPAA